MFKTLSDIIHSFSLEGSKDSRSTYRDSAPKRRAQFPKDTFDFLSLLEKWPDIIGERWSKHTIPLKLKFKTLTILTNHSAFSQELSFMSEILKQKIVQEFPNLKSSLNKVQFQVNSAFFEEEREKAEKQQAKHRPENNIHPYSPLYKKLKKEAGDYFEQIEEGEIKEILTSIFIQQKQPK